MQTMQVSSSCGQAIAQRHSCPAQARFGMPAMPLKQNLRTPVLRRNAECGIARRQSVIAAAAAAEPKADKISPGSGKEWYALVANAEFMLHDVQNESFAEQLREKVRYYKEQGFVMDFYLVSEPAWLDEKFPKEAKRVGRPCVALVCKDRQWALFMKLRLDRVMFLELGEMDDDLAAKSTKPVPEFGDFKNWTAPYSPYAPGWWNAFMKQ